MANDKNKKSFGEKYSKLFQEINTKKLLSDDVLAKFTESHTKNSLDLFVELLFQVNDEEIREEIYHYLDKFKWNLTEPKIIEKIKETDDWSFRFKNIIEIFYYLDVDIFCIIIDKLYPDFSHEFNLDHTTIETSKLGSYLLSFLQESDPNNDYVPCHYPTIINILGDISYEEAIPFLSGLLDWVDDSNYDGMSYRTYESYLIEDSMFFIRRLAIIVLAKIGDKSCLPAIMKGLGDPHVEVNIAAVIAIGTIGTKESIMLLRKIKYNGLMPEFVTEHTFNFDNATHETLKACAADVLEELKIISPKEVEIIEEFILIDNETSEWDIYWDSFSTFYDHRLKKLLDNCSNEELIEIIEFFLEVAYSIDKLHKIADFVAAFKYLRKGKYFFNVLLEQIRISSIENVVEKLPELETLYQDEERTKSFIERLKKEDFSLEIIDNFYLLLETKSEGIKTEELERIGKTLARNDKLLFLLLDLFLEKDIPYNPLLETFQNFYKKLDTKPGGLSKKIINTLRDLGDYLLIQRMLSPLAIVEIDNVKETEKVLLKFLKSGTSSVLNSALKTIKEIGPCIATKDILDQLLDLAKSTTGQIDRKYVFDAITSIGIDSIEYIIPHLPEFTLKGKIPQQMYIEFGKRKPDLILPFLKAWWVPDSGISINQAKTVSNELIKAGNDELIDFHLDIYTNTKNKYYHRLHSSEIINQTLIHYKNNHNEKVTQDMVIKLLVLIKNESNTKILSRTLHYLHNFNNEIYIDKISDIIYLMTYSFDKDVRSISHTIIKSFDDEFVNSLIPELISVLKKKDYLNPPVGLFSLFGRTKEPYNAEVIKLLLSFLPEYEDNKAVIFSSLGNIGKPAAKLSAEIIFSYLEKETNTYSKEYYIKPLSKMGLSILKLIKRYRKHENSKFRYNLIDLLRSIGINYPKEVMSLLKYYAKHDSEINNRKYATNIISSIKKKISS